MIYLDNAATTPVHPRVIEAMRPHFSECFGNPSSLHRAGREARKTVEDARETIADLLRAEPRQILFTGCATEADNLAVFGAARAARSRGNHIITSGIEHPAVLKACQALQHEGFQVTIVPADDRGLVKTSDVKRAIRPETILIAVMMVNNEVGTVQPVSDIANLAAGRGIMVHTDAVQAIGKIKINVKALNIDFLALAGHKIHAPKGIGALYVKDRRRLQPLLVGGGHEFEKRAGTENVPYIVGLAEAMKLVHQDMDAQTSRLGRLRDRMWNGIRKSIPDVQLNGHPEQRVPNILNVSFAGVKGEGLLLKLDAEGICVSSGSACSSEAMELSHVLTAMGLPMERIRGSIRFSMGWMTTEQEIDFVLDRLSRFVQDIRALKPFSAEAL